MRADVALIVLSCLTTCPFATPQQDPPDETRALIQAAEHFFAQGRWLEAKEQCERVRLRESDWTTPALQRVLRLELDACMKGNLADELQMSLTAHRLYGRGELVHWEPRNRWQGQEEEKVTALRKFEHFERLFVWVVDKAENSAALAPALRSKLLAERLAVTKQLATLLIGTDLGQHYGSRLEPAVWWSHNWHQESQEEHEDDRYFFNYFDDGLRRDPQGRPAFTPMVDKYRPDLIHGAKVLYLLREVERLDATGTRADAAEALLARALLARQLYGPQSTPQWRTEEMVYTWNRKPFFRSGPSRVAKHSWELADTEAITTVQGRAELVTLPAEENPLVLLRQLEQRYPESGLLPEALYQRGLYYQSRQQFDQADAEYQALIRRFPQHRRATDAATQRKTIARGSVLLGRTRAHAAGDAATLSFAYRQTDRIEFTARVFDMKRYVNDVIAGKRNDFNPQGLGEELLPREVVEPGNEDESGLRAYVGAEKARWTQQVPRTAHLSTAQSKVPFSDLGAYLIEARLPGQAVSSTVLLVYTDRHIVTQQLGGKLLLYVADAATGRPAAGQEVVFFKAHLRSLRRSTRRDVMLTGVDGQGDDQWEVTRKRADVNGVIEWPHAKPHEYQTYATVVSPQGGVALSYVGPEPGYDRPYNRDAPEVKNIVLTDRPAYRPGETMQFRLWRRIRKGNAFETPRAGERVTMVVYGPEHREVKRFELAVDEHGGASGSYPFHAEVPLGVYTLGTMAGLHNYRQCGTFRVEAYKKPEYEVRVTSESVAAGKVRLRIQGKYYFGAPVARGEVRYAISRMDDESETTAVRPFDWLYGPGYGLVTSHYPWLGDPAGDPGPDIDDEEWMGYGLGGSARRVLYRSGLLHLNDQGELVTELELPALKSGSRFQVEAWVRDEARRAVKGTGTMNLGAKPLHATLLLDRNWYVPGAQASVEVLLRHSDGTPRAGLGHLTLERITFPQGPSAAPRFERLRDEPVTVANGGAGQVTVPLTEAGQYRLTFTTQGTTASQYVWVYGDGLKCTTHRCPDLEVIPDQATYQVGDVARVLVLTRQPNARLLWCDEIGAYHVVTSYRFIDLPGGVGVVDVKIGKQSVPNFHLRAAVVSRGQLHQQDTQLCVPPREQLLQVATTLNRPEFRPGQDGQLTVKLTDHTGQPVRGVVTLAVYDKAVTYIAPDAEQPLRQFLIATVHSAPAYSPFRQLWGSFSAGGRFVCPQFELYDEHVPRGGGGLGGGGLGGGLGGGGLGGGGLGGGLGGALPDAGDPGDAGARRTQPREARSPSEASVDPNAVREHFSDTALWRAFVETGVDGTTTQPIRFPDSLTTWRLRADAITSSTQIGDTVREVVVSKPLLVRLQSPRFLLEGDTVTLSAVVNSALGEALAPEVSLELPPGDALRPVDATGVTRDERGGLLLRKNVQLTAQGSVRVDWTFQVLQPGPLVVKAAVRTDAERDAMAATIPVLSRGQLHTYVRQGSIRSAGPASADWAFHVPADTITAQTQLDLSFSPGPIGAVLDALPFLMDYPYGCVEQTMSRFYPTVIAAHTLRRMGIQLADLKQRQGNAQPALADRFGPRGLRGVFEAAEMRRMEEAGLARLTKFRHTDGGWGWWESDASSPYMTAYVLTGLHEAAAAGTAVPAELIDDGYYYLAKQLEKRDLVQLRHGDDGGATRALILYALSLGGSPEFTKRFDRDFRLQTSEQLKTAVLELYRGRDKLNPYGRVLLTLTLTRLKKTDEAKTLLRELLAQMRRDGDKHEVFLPTGDKDWWRWWNSDIEVNAWLLRALVQLDPQHADGPRLVHWLLQRRENGFSWRSTRDSALAVAALAEYQLGTTAAGAPAKVAILLNNQPFREVTVSPQDVLAESRLRLTTAELPVGRHVVTVRTESPAAVFFAGQLRYFSRSYQPPDPAGELAIERTYHLVDLATNRVTSQVPEGATLPSGSLIEVRLAIRSKQAYDYCAFIDPRPAGAEPAQLHSGGQWLGGLWANVEYRDDRTQIFVPQLEPGMQTIRYRLRLETPGAFTAAPTHGFAMYAPAVQARSTPFRMTVK